MRLLAVALIYAAFFSSASHSEPTEKRFVNIIHEAELRGTASNSRRIYKLTYISALTAKIDEQQTPSNRCQWSYEKYELDRTLTYIDDQGQQHTAGTIHFSRVPTEATDHSAMSCASGLKSDAERMNSTDAWRGEIAADRPLVDEILGKPLP